ncbi:uncharacterized protein LOC110699800 [Chenopodium quinoa]|uniref:uncharacterized protein LOC110699800 n=1 Tax=Chenopodium quinoa TaxID=63459 RepID=UPI000B77C1EE|nr:uncharacterized protein LOC110699800 [Chenopodium quinoa]
MSPFLFAIGMEYLSRCLDELRLSPDFNFHPRCEKLNLTHMMFADDLLMFSRADSVSVKLLFQAFSKFSGASGLSANLDKSEVYFGGVSIDVQKELRELFGVSQGTIPFRYLGVPLSSKKLTNAQCRPLVERVTARIQGWMAKHLSYAGRLQLVKSVLFGIQTYWAQIFILPKKILKEIEARFRCFLWTGSSAPAKKSLVAWNNVCLPKVCGGWNLLSLPKWNKAAVTKLLWDIAHKADNLWVKWVHIYYFKHKDCWTTPTPARCSWFLKKILSYRDVVNDQGGWDGFIQGNKLKIKKLYADIRPQVPKVPWKRVTCHNLATPKSIFILWLALWNRLVTKDRLLQWHISCDPRCFLCLNGNESVQHLFFDCEFSRKVWSKVLGILHVSKHVQQFSDEVNWMKKICKSSRLKNKVIQVAFTETVYGIWIQRNAVLFTGCWKSVDALVRDIVFHSIICLVLVARLALFFLVLGSDGAFIYLKLRFPLHLYCIAVLFLLTVSLCFLLVAAVFFVVSALLVLCSTGCAAVHC